jgi:hypothetical protein
MEHAANQSCPRSVVDSTRDSGSLSVGSNPAEGVPTILLVRITFPQLLDTTAFAVVFYFFKSERVLLFLEKFFTRQFQRC